jgi:Na+/proline symporter
MNKYLDWQFRSTSVLTLLVALACIVCAFVLPDSFGDKNSPIENVQMLIVAIGLYVTYTARARGPLYVFATLCMFFILAREVNYGRTLFIFADPENANLYPKWKDMEYGWVAHVCVGLYMLWLLVYFFWRKVWKQALDVLKTERIPAWELLLAIGGMLTGVLFESLHNCLSEELGEVVLYVGGVCILYLYSRSKTRKVLC